MPDTLRRRPTAARLRAAAVLNLRLLLVSCAFAVPSGAATLIECDESGSTGGDNADRGFYVQRFPSNRLDTATLYLRSDSAGDFPVTLVARSDAFDGGLLGEATATLTTNPGSKVEVLFDFGGAPVPRNGRVTFQLDDGPGDLSYDVGTTSNPLCTGIVQTNTTTPPLSTFRRNRVGITLTGRTPSPNLLLSPGFDDPASLDDWPTNVFGSVTWSALDVDDAADSGSALIGVDAPNAGNTRTIVSSCFPASPGDELDLGTWAYIPTQSVPGRVTPILIWFATDDCTGSSVSSVNAGGNDPPLDRWFHSAITTTVPEGAASQKLFLGGAKSEAAAEDFELYVDSPVLAFVPEPGAGLAAGAMAAALALLGRRAAPRARGAGRTRRRG